ncbi:MAG TPA: hypothetical protein VMS21_15535, partial [Methylomirabilota bacterium]|nr:hypothetical protein [Methylomirabilota bacterium]
LVVGATALPAYLHFSTPRGPTLLCSAYDPKSRTAIVELTNATSRSWLFRLHLVQGSPRPSYFITDQKKGMPGWGIEVEDGILHANYLYRRDSSGRFGAPERSGRAPRLTTTITNVLLEPQQALTFSVPIGDIPGLSKVGVEYLRPPASSRRGRVTANVLQWVRRLLHLQPPTPFKGWCETELPAAAQEH